MIEFHIMDLWSTDDAFDRLHDVNGGMFNAFTIKDKQSHVHFEEKGRSIETLIHALNMSGFLVISASQHENIG